MVANQRPDIAFVVLMAGTAVNGEKVLLEQAPAVMRASGVPQDKIDANSEMQKKIFEVLRVETDGVEAAKKLSAILPSGPQADAQIRQMTSAWFLHFVKYDPAPALEKVKCPVLAVNGELDRQVLPEQNLPVIEASLKKGGNKDFKVERLAGLNHLFQAAKTGGPSEYGQIEETMSPVALNAISAWVKQKTGVK
jgi:fermentation-respiration switch protein FrsA (DUF1100 family)